MSDPALKILPVIVFAQFACTSLWFAGNAVIPELTATFDYPPAALSYITSAVQFGFIVGTLVYAILNIADRISPSLVFFLSALAAGLCNSSVLLGAGSFPLLLAMRFLTGFFLAGIYPVGMKIASDYFDHGLGRALGFLVGALVVGTAFPHLIKGLSAAVNWKAVLLATSALSLLGGLSILLLVPDGPYRKRAQHIDLTAFFTVFKNKPFRSASFGYFGHMWELYAFWAFVPLIIATYPLPAGDQDTLISLASFAVIGIGGIACVLGGLLSEKAGVKKVAAISLFCSGLCCLFSPLSFSLPFPVFLGFLLFWGMVVIADSPLFSTLVAQSAIPELKGTALTIATCVGFGVTIFSIQLLDTLSGWLDDRYIYLFLSAGPLFGLLAIRKKTSE